LSLDQNIMADTIEKAEDQGGRFRCWLFTAWKELNYEKLNTTFIIAGTENCPTTGKLHWQGYMQLARRYTFGAVKKMFERAGDDTCNFRKARGTCEQNIVYCSKMGDVYKSGDPLAQGTRSDLHQIADELIKDPKRTIEDVMEDDPAVYCQYRQGLTAIANYSEIKHSKKNWRIITESYIEMNDVEKAKDAIHLTFKDAYFLHSHDSIKWRRYMGEEVIAIVNPIYEDRRWLVRREPLDLKVSYGEKTAKWTHVIYICPIKQVLSWEPLDDEANVGKWWRLFGAVEYQPLLPPGPNHGVEPVDSD